MNNTNRTKTYRQNSSKQRYRSGSRGSKSKVALSQHDNNKNNESLTEESIFMMHRIPTDATTMNNNITSTSLKYLTEPNDFNISEVFANNDNNSNVIGNYNNKYLISSSLLLQNFLEQDYNNLKENKAIDYLKQISGENDDYYNNSTQDEIDKIFANDNDHLIKSNLNQYKNRSNNKNAMSQSFLQKQPATQDSSITIIQQSDHNFIAIPPKKISNFQKNQKNPCRSVTPSLKQPTYLDLKNIDTPESIRRKTQLNYKINTSQTLRKPIRSVSAKHEKIRPNDSYNFISSNQLHHNYIKNNLRPKSQPSIERPIKNAMRRSKIDIHKGISNTPIIDYSYKSGMKNDTHHNNSELIINQSYGKFRNIIRSKLKNSYGGQISISPNDIDLINKLRENETNQAQTPKSKEFQQRMEQKLKILKYSSVNKGKLGTNVAKCLAKYKEDKSLSSLPIHKDQFKFDDTLNHSPFETPNHENKPQANLNNSFYKETARNKISYGMRDIIPFDLLQFNRKLIPQDNIKNNKNESKGRRPSIFTLQKIGINDISNHDKLTMLLNQNSYSSRMTDFVIQNSINYKIKSENYNKEINEKSKSNLQIKDKTRDQNFEKFKIRGRSLA